MADVTLPKLSDSMEEGTIVRWLVEDGSAVKRGQEIVEVETDKAIMAYESEFDGVIHFAAADGDTLPVGAVIAQVLAAGEPEPVAVAATPPTRVNASPVARRVAAELKVELSQLVGSGPRGRIVKRDVEAVSGNGAAAEAPPAPAPAPVAQPVAAETATARGTVRSQDLSRIQTLIARRMAEAKATMPEFTLTTDIDMDEAVRLRAQLKALDPERAPSFNDLVVKACARALARHPRANGAYGDGRFDLFERVNVGVAVAAAEALLVPTIFDADRKSLGALAVESRDLALRAREGRLTPPELAGGTFTVSNLGMFGITHFTAVLNPPQAAILAVGALEQRAVVRDGAPAVGHRMTVTLTCDHRILYGADAAAFLADIRTELEQPLQLAL
jgi:pyruvate dehydrogenase E2 component (dihydrolipoamide acetyltransferase)